MDRVCQNYWEDHGDGESESSDYGFVNVSKSNICGTFTVSLNWKYKSSDRVQNIFSSAFQTDNNKWELKVLPYGFGCDCDHVSVGVRLIECPSGIPQCVQWRDPINDSYCEQIFKCGEIWGIAHSIERADSLDLLLNFYIAEKSFKNEVSNSNISIDNSLFESDLTDILYTKDRDITLYGADWELRAHKEVLVAKSSVFTAMFESSMIESQTNRIEITDIEPRVVKALLNYLYIGKPSVGMDDILPQLYLASSKYQLDKLTSYCERLLCNDIDTSNVFERVQIADLTQSDLISDACSEFIVNNYDNVQAHEGWNKFEENNKTFCVVLNKLLKKSKSYIYRNKKLN